MWIDEECVHLTQEASKWEGDVKVAIERLKNVTDTWLLQQNDDCYIYIRLEVWILIVILLIGILVMCYIQVGKSITHEGTIKHKDTDETDIGNNEDDNNEDDKIEDDNSEDDNKYDDQEDDDKTSDTNREFNVVTPYTDGFTNMSCV
jgi:hypothetical protein